MFSSYFDIGNVTDPAERQRQVETLVEHLAPDQLQRLPLLNDVLNLGLPDNELTAAMDPDLRQQSLTLLLTRLLQIWTQERPLVVVLEDVHWLDSLSWELATRVVRSLSVSTALFYWSSSTAPWIGARLAPPRPATWPRS